MGEQNWGAIIVHSTSTDFGLGYYQSLTLGKVVVKIGHADFSPGLLFVAISHVKSLAGLALCSHFDITQLQKPTGMETMKMLQVDNKRQSQLGFQLNTYGINLSEYEFESEI